MAKVVCRELGAGRCLSKKLGGALQALDLFFFFFSFFILKIKRLFTSPGWHSNIQGDTIRVRTNRILTGYQLAESITGRSCRYKHLLQKRAVFIITGFHIVDVWRYSPASAVTALLITPQPGPQVTRACAGVLSVRSARLADACPSDVGQSRLPRASGSRSAPGSRHRTPDSTSI
jgi:hypothetical protein